MAVREAKALAGETIFFCCNQIKSNQINGTFSKKLLFNTPSSVCLGVYQFVLIPYPLRMWRDYLLLYRTPLQILLVFQENINIKRNTFSNLLTLRIHYYFLCTVVIFLICRLRRYGHQCCRSFSFPHHYCYLIRIRRHIYMGRNRFTIDLKFVSWRAFWRYLKLLEVLRLAWSNIQGLMRTIFAELTPRFPFTSFR